MKNSGLITKTINTPTTISASGVWSLQEQYEAVTNNVWPEYQGLGTAKVYLDANNVNSYSGSGTTWSDLSGNNYDFTLSSSGLYNSSGPKYMAFQGQNDVATYSGSNDVPLSESNGITYVVATRIISSSTATKVLTKNDTAYAPHYGDWHVKITNYDIGMRSVEGFIAGGTPGTRDSGLNQDDLPSHANNDWIFLYFRWANGEGYKLSYNDTPGTIRGSLETDVYAPYDEGGFRFLGNHGWQTAQYAFPWGDIGFFAAWETELSDGELTEIYNSEKSRFGL
jgi:hypothetical protein